MHIRPHTAVGDLSCLRDSMSCPAITVHEPADSKSLPLKWCASHPVIGKKILCFFFEPIGATELSFVLTGTRFCSRVCRCLSLLLGKTRYQGTRGTSETTSKGRDLGEQDGEWRLLPLPEER